MTSETLQATVLDIALSSTYMDGTTSVAATIIQEATWTTKIVIKIEINCKLGFPNKLQLVVEDTKLGDNSMKVADAIIVDREI